MGSNIAYHSNSSEHVQRASCEAGLDEPRKCGIQAFSSLSQQLQWPQEATFGLVRDSDLVEEVVLVVWLVESDLSCVDGSDSMLAIQCGDAFWLELYDPSRLPWLAD